MARVSLTVRGVLWLTATIAAVNPVSAQTSGIWNIDANGVYNLVGNWDTGTVPDGGGTATFGSVITTGRTITLDISPTLAAIVFSNQNSPGGYTISTATAQVFNLNAGGSITNGANASNTISAGITLAGSVTIGGSGLANLTLSGPITGAAGSILINTATPIAENGFVILGNAGSNFAGGVTLQSGNLAVTNAAALGTGGLSVTGANTTLSSSGAAVTLANNVSLNGGALNLTGTVGTTLTGVISNVGPDTNGLNILLRTTTAPVNLQGANTYVGATVVRPNPFVTTGLSNTNLVFSGAAGSALNSSSFTATSATIALDNTGVAFTSRVGASPVNLNTGTFRIIGGTDGADVTQNAGALTGTGLSIVNVVAGSGPAGTTMNFAQLNRGTVGNPRATFLFTGSATFGAGPGATNLTFGVAPITPTGLGTTAADVIPYAVGDAGAGATLNGTNFVTYDANGVRLLTGAETVGSLVAGQNVRLTAAGVNTGAVAIKSLAVAGATTGSADLTGGGAIQMSGPVLAVNTAAGATQVVHTIAQNLDFGAAEGNFFAPSGNNGGATFLILNGNLSSNGGGMTFSGAGNSSNYVIVPNNSYTGPTTVNRASMQFADASAFGRSTDAITFNGVMGFGFGGLGFTQLAATDLNGRGLVSNHGHNTLAVQGSGGVMVVSGPMSGDGAITTSTFGAGTAGGRVILAGNNTTTYTTRVASNVLVEIGSDANLGASPYLALSGGSSLLSGISLSGNWTTSKGVLVNAASRLATNGFNAQLNGVLTGASGLTKAGAGDLNLTAVNNYSGTLVVQGGTLTLSGQGRLNNTNTIGISGASLILDNTGSPLSNRLSTNATLGTSGSSSTLRINSGGANITESLLSLTIGGGGGNSTVRLDASSGGTVLFTPTNIGESNSRSILVAGTGLANSAAQTTPGTTGMRMTTLPTLVGGGGGSGTPTISILPGGYGDTNPAGFGTGLITHINGGGNTVGVRLLDPTEYTVNAFTPATANSRVTAASSTGTNTVNSLFVDNANLTVTSGSTLTVTSGTMLVTGAGPITLTGDGVAGGGGVISSGGTAANQVRGLILNTTTDVTNNLVFNSTSTVAGWRLVKLGPGTLNMDPRNSIGNFTQGVTGTNISAVNIYGGTIEITAADADINAIGATNIVMTNDARLRMTARGSQTGRTMTVNGIGGRLDLTGSAIQLTGTGAILTGTGNLTLEGGTLVLGGGTSGTPAALQASTLNGGITVNAGATLVLNADNGATNGPLGDPASPLNLNGGALAARFGTRTVQNPVNVNANTTFANNLTVSLPALGGTIPDTNNAGLAVNTPVRLNTGATLTNALQGPATTRLTFNGGFYDNPFVAASALTLANTGGASETVLAGPSIHRGGTTVASGSVIVSNIVGSATGRGNVVVNAGARLAGGNATATSGFVYPASGGTVTVNGTVEPGNGLTSIGQLTVGSPNTDVLIAINGLSSRYVFNLASTAAGSATPISDGSSTIIVGVDNNFFRGLALSAASSLDFSPATFAINAPALGGWDPNLYYSWQVATLSAGPVTVAAPIFDETNFNNLTFGPGSFALAQVGQNVFLNYSPVPEPATVLAIAAAGAGAVGLVRRRWKKGVS